MLLWHGRELKHSVLPGVGAGLMPLSLAIFANRIGHVCLEESCTPRSQGSCRLGGEAESRMIQGAVWTTDREAEAIFG